LAKVLRQLEETWHDVEFTAEDSLHDSSIKLLTTSDEIIQTLQSNQVFYC
jgi:hypothetical protein